MQHGMRGLGHSGSSTMGSAEVHSPRVQPYLGRACARNEELLQKQQFEAGVGADMGSLGWSRVIDDDLEHMQSGVRVLDVRGIDQMGSAGGQMFLPSLQQENEVELARQQVHELVCFCLFIILLTCSFLSAPKSVHFTMHFERTLTRALFFCVCRCSNFSCPATVSTLQSAMA